jgi:transposase InsO family protein
MGPAWSWSAGRDPYALLREATPQVADERHRRLHGACGNIPPVEYEDNYYRSIAGLAEDCPAGRPRVRWSQVTGILAA